MSNFAQIDENNVVVKVISGDNNDSNGDEGYSWITETFGGNWIQTSYNTFGNKHPEDRPLHKNYAAVGFSWDGIGFYAQQPFPSWNLDKETYLWKPPTPRPKGLYWVWDEKTLSWIEVE